MAVNRQFFKPAPLDLTHSNNPAIESPLDSFRVRPQDGIDNLRQILKVRDVVDLRKLRNHGFFIVDASPL